MLGCDRRGRGIALVAVYNVSPFRLRSAKRNQVSAQGSIEILVDSSRSPIADARRSMTGLTARAGVFSRYIAGGRVIGLMAKDSGIPLKQIDVASPAPLPGRGAQASRQNRPRFTHTALTITQPDELPIVQCLNPRADRAKGSGACGFRGARRGSPGGRLDPAAAGNPPR